MLGMHTIRIKTAQNIDIDYEVAGIGERTIARIIDYALFLALWLIYLWLFDVFMSKSVLFGFTLPQILFFVFYAFYDLICEVVFNGQSLGKFVMKIRVVSLDGGRPRLGQYLLRYLFRAADFTLAVPAVAIFSVAVTENKQRIGDIVANTTLIKTKPKAGINELNTALPDEEYQPVFMEATNLSDQDIALVHEVIRHFLKTGNMAFVDNMAKKIQTHLDITPPEGLNNYKFLQTIIKDHQHVLLNLNPQIG